MKVTYYNVVLFDKTPIGLRMEYHKCCTSIPSAIQTGLSVLESYKLNTDHSEERSKFTHNAPEKLIVEAGFAIEEHSKEELHILIDMEAYVLCVDEKHVEMEG